MARTLVVVEEVSGRNLKWLRANCRDTWQVVCLDKDDLARLEFAADRQAVDLRPYVSELTDMSLALMDREPDRLEPAARTLSGILKLDISLALRRYLLNTYYLRRARVAKIQSLGRTGERDWLYVDRDTVTGSEGFLNVRPTAVRWMRCRPLGNFVYRAAGSLKSLFRRRPGRADLLLNVIPATARRLHGILEQMHASGVNLAAVDKSNGRILYGPTQRARRAGDRFYKYALRALLGYARFLRSAAGTNVLLARFMSVALAKKYETLDLYAQFRCRTIVVEDEYDLFQSIVCRLLRDRDVSVLNIMHGEKTYGLRDAMAEHDEFLVWGEYYRALFERLRYRGRQITVVGNPAYDQINDYQPATDELLQIRESHRKVISVYTQVTTGTASVEWQSRMLRDICEYVRNKPDVFVFVRRHPYEYKCPTLDYDRIIGALANVRMCGKEVPLYDLVCISDVVATPYSTVGLEGILFRKNVLYFNYGGIDDLVPYPGEGAAIEIRESGRCAGALDALLEGTVELDHQKTIDLHANGLDGRAAEHVREKIMKHL